MAETQALRDYLASDKCRDPSDEGALAASIVEYATRPGIDTLLCSIEHSRLALHHSMSGAVH